MARIDRYILSQLLGVFCLSALVLVAIYWLNRAIALLDSLVGDGQSVWVFLQMSLLTIPAIIELIAPMAAFGAAIFVANRLINDSELVVLQATGFSYWRLSRPTFFFGIMVALFTAVVVNILAPAAATQRRELSTEISRNTTAKYLKEGQFLQPAPGIVLYIRAISEDGQLDDIFISDTREDSFHQTYSAQRAFVVNDQGEPKLLMLEGVMQRKSSADEILSVSKFADLTYSLAGLIKNDRGDKRSIAELSTAELISATPTSAYDGSDRADKLKYRGHQRISWPLSTGLTAMIGYCTLLLGGFSRQGIWWQILLASCLLLIMYATHIAALAQGPKINGGWVFAYVTPIVGIAFTIILVRISQRTKGQKSFVKSLNLFIARPSK